MYTSCSCNYRTLYKRHLRKKTFKSNLLKRKKKFYILEKILGMKQLRCHACKTLIYNDLLWAYTKFCRFTLRLTWSWIPFIGKKNPFFKMIQKSSHKKNWGKEIPNKYLIKSNHYPILYNKERFELTCKWEKTNFEYERWNKLRVPSRLSEKRRTKKSSPIVKLENDP